MRLEGMTKYNSKLDVRYYPSKHILEMTQLANDSCWYQRNEASFMWYKSRV